jgi:type I restriction enzyme S subunit
VQRNVGWTAVAFGNVVRQVRDPIAPDESGLERYVAGEHMDTDDLRIRRWGEIGDGYLGPAFHMRFKPGHVLYGSRRTYLRKIAVADFEGITANTTYVLESADPDVLLPELLPFIMRTEAFTQYSVRESKGSVNPYVNFSDLARFEFALPPIDEQRRIYRVLDAANTAYESLVTMAEATRQLQGAISANLILSAKPSEIVPLCQAAKEDIQKIKVSKELAYRTVGVLNGGQGLFHKESLRGADTRYSHLIVLKTNQLVMRKLTAWEGAIAVVAREFDGACVSTEFPTISLDGQRLHPDYMAWVITQPSFWREMKARSKGTALRRSRLHQRDLLKIPIWIPSIARQEEVVERLTAVREAVRATENRAQDARGVLKSLIERSLAVDTRRANARNAGEAL